MGKLLSFILFLLFPSLGWANGHEFILKGEISGIKYGTASIRTSDYVELYSAPIEGGRFVLEGELPKPGRYYITVNRMYIDCFIDGHSMTLTGEYNQLKAKNLAGSPANDLSEEYYGVIEDKVGTPLNRELATYRKLLEDNDQEGADQKMEVLLELEELRYLLTKEFISQHPGNIFSAYIAQLMSGDSYERSVEIYGLLDPENKKSEYGKALEKRMNELRASALWELSSDFEARSEAGEMVSLYSCLGNIIVLDFWASWCAPCREEMKNLRQQYNEFHDRGVRFISISLDDSKEKWEKACEEEQIPWLSLHEERGWTESLTRQIYGIKTIPFIVLLDEKGRIVAKNIRRESLRNKIIELLNNRAQ